MATEIKTNGYNGMMLDAYKNAAETATYIDGNGNRKKGVLADSPVPASSDPAGGLTGQESIAELYKMAYDRQVSAVNEQTAAQIAELQRRAEEQKSLAAEDYRKANEQLYLDYMRGERTLPQQLAALGITGGAAESSEIALRNGYQGNVYENERARLLGERSIDSELASARVQAQLASGEAENNAAIQYYSNLIAQRQQEEEKAEAERKERQQMRASALAEVGDYSGLVEMGILSQPEAEALKKSWIAQNPDLAESLGYVEKKKSSGSGYKSEADSLYEDTVSVFNKVLAATGDKEQAQKKAYMFTVENKGNLDAGTIRSIGKRLQSEGVLETLK